jgi:hypothetical protein
MERAMKKAFLVTILTAAVFLFSQKKILIDNIHGADYIGEDFAEGLVIDFHAVFPDDELTVLTPDSLPFENILIEETITGAASKTYTVDLPDGYYPEMPICLYAYAKCNFEDFWLKADGFIKDPDGGVIAEFFQGSAHVENANGQGWSVVLNDLYSSLSYDVKIGYGRPLFKAPAIEGKYELTGWDLIVRIMDNCYYAIVGNPPLYGNYDLSALGEAFSQGMSFIFTDHYYDSMSDKPYIHFYSDEDVEVSPGIKFPGTFTLLSDGAKKVKNKSEMLISSEWAGHNVQKNSDNELVYEGALNEKLNFLHFDIVGTNVTVINKIPHKLNDLFLLKYHSSGIYKFAGPVQLAASGRAEVTDWQYLNPDQVISEIEKAFYERGIKEGLTELEITNLINDFHWIESLLYRAKINYDDHFGFYHFGKDVYDKLIGFECEPYPETLNRTMWVMLSYINERSEEPPAKLNMASAKAEIKKGLKANEYGVTDEYYLPKQYESESGLFGISRAGYTDSWLMDRLYFYDTPFADHFSNGWSYIGAVNGAFRYVHDDINTRILYVQGYEQEPSAYGKVINENGQLAVIGTSFFFSSSYPPGNTFLRTTAGALVDERVLTGIENAENSISTFSLTAYPNPFNPSTVISISLKKEAVTELTVFDRNGREVAKLQKGKLSAGTHQYTFEGSELSSGVYFCRLVSDGITAARRKVVLLK